MQPGRWLVALSLTAAVPAFGQEKLLTDWGTFTFERDLGSTTGVVAGPPDSVYGVLKAIFADRKLAMMQEDQAGREISIKRLRLTRRLGKQPVSLYLTCGEGLEGPNADLWHVFLSLGARVTPATTGARLQLLLSAEAVDVPGGRSERVACATTGRLEFEVLTHLRQVFPGT